MGGGDAGARRSLCAAMDVDVVHPAMAVAKDEGDLELKRIAMEFLSHYCSATPSVMSGAVHGEADKKQKRSATQSFLVPCSNASAKKQCVAHCGEGLEALKELGEGAKDLTLLLLTSGRDPGIIPRNTHPPEPESFDGSNDTGVQTPQQLRLPRTKDVVTTYENFSVLIVVGASFLFSNLPRSPMAIGTYAAIAVPR
ncbi:hypothetical protein E2562_008599 [Oryza meyeriana var. granulata]|uniref:Uncharacterized protein n=1 Tax=Oryza meyeriana var. granulata TaxID=110450 RepID=A0A6G1C5N8_9ORYZ|nr:hypothetical protein E2562_008599 [Oryza meyeriana var. granulata]